MEHYSHLTAEKTEAQVKKFVNKIEKKPRVHARHTVNYFTNMASLQKQPYE